MSNDEEIKHAVIHALKRETRITNPDAIQVDVKEGIVTLSGRVDNYMDQVTAGSLACCIPGVEGVVQNIEVALPPGSARSDLDIAKDANQALALNSSIPHDRLKVIVKDGFVVIEGEVNWPHEKEEAELTVSRIAGIRGITSAIVVREPIRPIDIWSRIEKAFQRAALHHATHVTVHIDDGKVVLSGTVRAYFEIAEAERAAREAPGVKVVENRLEVPPLLQNREPREATDEERR